jgi:hypothetical protein
MFFEALQADLKEMEEKSRRYFLHRNYIEMGLYCEQILRFIEAFGRENVLVLMLEDLAKNPEATMAKVTTHLALAPLPSLNGPLNEPSNTYKSPRNGLQAPFLCARRALSPKVREKVLPGFLNEWLRNSSLLYTTKKPAIDLRSQQLLQEIFAPDLIKLQGLLGRELPELRRSWVSNASEVAGAGRVEI